MDVPCRPRCYPGRRRGRALGRRPPAAGPGRMGKRCRLRAGGVGPWHRSADPGRGATEHRAAQGPVARAWPRGAGYRPPDGTWMDRHQPWWNALSALTSCSNVVFGVRSGLRRPRRLTAGAIAGEAPVAVFGVLRVSRAVQRRRPRIAVGSALVVAGAVARLRAASAEPLGNSRPAAATAIRERLTPGGRRRAPGY
jgi:hypothetical protein